ncbi:hypothetical protein [Methylobacterium oxalidis]|uniref:hypothetical protein n=1 Tax=Methylobacterium oxalidis TaxID=944322 RepID=UPI003315588D
MWPGSIKLPFCACDTGSWRQVPGGRSQRREVEVIALARDDFRQPINRIDDAVVRRVNR